MIKYLYLTCSSFDMVNTKSKYFNMKEKCYTCNKTPFVKNHVIYTTDKYEIHFCLKHQCRLIVTPNNHVQSISDLGEEFIKIYEDVKNFLNSYDVKGFSLNINEKQFQTHDHNHWKIYISQPDIDIILQDKFILYNNYIYKPEFKKYIKKKTYTQS